MLFPRCSLTSPRTVLVKLATTTKHEGATFSLLVAMSASTDFRLGFLRLFVLFLQAFAGIPFRIKTNCIPFLSTNGISRRGCPAHYGVPCTIILFEKIDHNSKSLRPYGLIEVKNKIRRQTNKDVSSQHSKLCVLPHFRMFPVCVFHVRYNEGMSCNTSSRPSMKLETGCPGWGIVKQPWLHRTPSFRAPHRAHSSHDLPFTTT